MKLAFLAAFLFLAGALAGCTQQYTETASTAPGRAPFDPGVLSKADRKALAPEEVWVPSSTDGKRMNAAVYRPDTDEKVPVFINFSPYWGDTPMTEGDRFAT